VPEPPVCPALPRASWDGWHNILATDWRWGPDPRADRRDSTAAALRRSGSWPLLP